MYHEAFGTNQPGLELSDLAAQMNAPTAPSSKRPALASKTGHTLTPMEAMTSSGTTLADEVANNKSTRKNRKTWRPYAQQLFDSKLTDSLREGHDATLGLGKPNGGGHWVTIADVRTDPLGNRSYVLRHPNRPDGVVSEHDLVRAVHGWLGLQELDAHEATVLGSVALPRTMGRRRHSRLGELGHTGGDLRAVSQEDEGRPELHAEPTTKEASGTVFDLRALTPEGSRAA